MGEAVTFWKDKIPEITWLVVMTLIGVVKIVVGTLYIGGGCLGFSFFPYFLLLGGLLALIPACIAVVTSLATKKSRSENSVQMWGLVAKLFFLSGVALVFGTVYILVSVTRVNHLNRLCTDVWVPAFGLCLLVVDWVTFAVFLRLFCVNSVPPEKPSPFDEDVFSESPFSMWRHRRMRR